MSSTTITPASTNEPEPRLMFTAFSSILNPGFWQQLTNIKLNRLKLSKEPLDVYGSYSCNLSDRLPCLASFDHCSFSEQSESGSGSTCPMYGKLVCLNVMEEFINIDKKGFLNSLGEEVWKSICTGDALSDPEKHLSKFGLLVYADLKRYKFFYWFSFPAINYPKDIHLVGSKNILDVFNEKQVQQLQEQYSSAATTSERHSNFQRGYFIVTRCKDTDRIQCLPLTDYKQVQTSSAIDIYFAFTDPSSNATHPGWPMRNFLSLIAVQYQLNEINIIRIRRTQTKSQNNLDLHCSTIVSLKITLDAKYKLQTNGEPNGADCPPITGWEKNETQQMAPKIVNLSNLLDPKKLAEDAVNLNLRLMKWRLLPELDLEKIANSRCLLLGCGTLGCHIARGLLAWGIKNITIVDNSKISYSNPVRQTLYTFDDCFKSGQGSFKAQAAAESLKRIHPTVNVEPIVLSIPMPGHHVGLDEVEQTKKDIEKLEKLIENHDVTFLLMDTRESRWLPTVIAMSKQKLVINAAIGFDTFLLQRYGIRDYSKQQQQQDEQTKPTDESSSPSSSAPPADTTTTVEPSASGSSYEKVHRTTTSKLESNKLGCYFCNDIVAPGDSTLDRTLDQQCTVSRPGVSMIVSALAVELLASIMSSDLGPLTPAPIEFQNQDQSMVCEEDFDSELGLVPHSIRGNLNRYHFYMPTSPYFNKCSACSQAVVEAYREQGYEFLHRVFEDPSYLEEIAGLKDLQNVSDDVWALESDEMIEED